MIVCVFLSTRMETYLPNLEELLFRTVLAFPKASKIGEQNKIRSSIESAEEEDVFFDSVSLAAAVVLFDCLEKEEILAR